MKVHFRKRLIKRLIVFLLTRICFFTHFWTAHRAKSTQRWLDEKGVKRFGGWPGNSPDLNVIENFRSQMKQMQSKERATSVAGLKKIAGKVWQQVTSAYLEKLYKLLLRMEAVIAASGGHTKY